MGEGFTAPDPAAHTADPLKLAKQGAFEELRGLADRGVALDWGKIFDRAVTDFRTVKRRAGHQEILALCLERGLDLMARVDWMKQPVLCQAAMYGNLEWIESIPRAELPDDPFVRASLGQLASSESPSGGPAFADLIDENGFNLLHYCAASGLGRRDDARREGLEECCELLIAQGVDTARSVVNNIPLTPALMCAWFGGNARIMELLLAAGEVEVSGLHQVVEFTLEPHQRSGAPFFSVAETVLAHGFELDSLRPDQDRCLLHGSANRGSKTAVRWLLEQGADPNVRDAAGATPLHAAAERNSHASAVRLLLEAGAEAEVTDAHGHTPLDIALSRGRTAVAEALRSFSAH